VARRDVPGAWALSALAGVVFFRVQDESAASGQLWIARANVLTAVVVVTDDEHLPQRATSLLRAMHNTLQLRRTSKSPSSTRCLPSPECRYTMV
jgi:hypothetical protein